MLIVYLSGGQAVEVAGATDLRVEHGQQFVGSDDPSILCVGDGDLVLAHFRAGEVIGYREVPDPRR